MNNTLRYLIAALTLTVLCAVSISAQEEVGEKAATEIQPPIDISSEIGEEIEEIEETVSENLTKKWNLFIRIGVAAAVVILQILLIHLIKKCFDWLHDKAAKTKEALLKPIKIKNYQLINSDQILSFIHFLLKVIQAIATLFQLFITLPIVFSLFEPTQDFASKLFSYILNPLKRMARSLVDYIPNIITIIIIIIVTIYTLRALRFFTVQIERKKLVLPGFYSDWAQPTFNILRVLLYAFSIIMIYPFLPSSETDVFKGVSVFIGLIFSLGSSSFW